MNAPATDDEELFKLVCQHGSADEFEARLKISKNVDTILMSLHVRGDQCLSLLMLAALYGNDDIVRIMLRYASNLQHLVELTGIVSRMNGTVVKNATALWCACERSHYTVAHTLIDLGRAQINHGPKYPLLIDAITVGRLDTVRFLIDHDYVGVNGHESNDNNRLNSLIMAVIYGQTVIVEYLIKKGSIIDYLTPSSHNTPLSYAAVKGHINIVRLLCEAGASSTTKNKNGYTPLMLAAKYERTDIVDYLFEYYDTETGIKQLEFVACSFIVATASNPIAHNPQFQKMINLTRKIFEIRQQRNFTKTVAQPIAAYSFQRECQTIEEFNEIQNDNERLIVEALLIRERYLVPENNEAVFKPLLVFGDTLAQRGQYAWCLDLWEHTFYLYQNMGLETGLHRFVWLLCKMYSSNAPISAERFVQIGRLTFQPSQQKQKDDYIKNSLCLLAIAMKLLERPTLAVDERKLIYQWISDVCALKRITSRGQTLLHLCVDEQTYYDINYRPQDIKPILKFPNIAITHLLVTNFSHLYDINAFESKHGNTPLHISSQNMTNDSLAIVQILINAGAHIDSMNMCKRTPLDLSSIRTSQTLLRKQQLPGKLKCLCACSIIENQVPYESIWSKGTSMHSFIFLHGGLAN